MKRAALSRAKAKTDVPAPRSRDGDTERRILDAAHAVFIRRGTGGARMQEIADEAGVNKALLHYYFRSKDRLADAVFRGVATELFSRVFELGLSDLDLHDKVRRIIAVYIDQMARTPYVPAYLIGEINQNPERAQQLLDAVGAGTVARQAHGARGGMPPVMGKIARQIGEEVAAGRMTPIAPRQFLANLISLCIFPFAAAPMLCAAFAMDARAFREFIDERKATLPEFFLNALRP